MYVGRRKEFLKLKFWAFAFGQSELANTRNVSLGNYFTLSTQLIQPNHLVTPLPTQHYTVSLQTYPFYFLIDTIRETMYEKATVKKTPCVKFSSL